MRSGGAGGASADARQTGRGTIRNRARLYRSSRDAGEGKARRDCFNSAVRITWNADPASAGRGIASDDREAAGALGRGGGENYRGDGGVETFHRVSQANRSRADA